MTPEERFQKIEEHLLVTAEKIRTSEEHLLVMTEMIRNNERRWEERFAGHDARLTRLEQVVEALASSQDKTLRVVGALAEKVDEVADDQALTRAMLQSLIKTVDRFIRGQGGDGRGRKGTRG